MRDIARTLTFVDWFVAIPVDSLISSMYHATPEFHLWEGPRVEDRFVQGFKNRLADILRLV